MIPCPVPLGTRGVRKTMTAMKTSLKASLIAVAIAALPHGSHAAGLGAINVFSGLGQPLRAEIELNATPQELQTLAAKVASVDAFRQANVSYSQVMTGVRLVVEPRGSRAVVKVSTDRPVNEPFLDLIVEINWSTGRMHRGYTFLLDPVDVGAAAAAPVSVAPPRVVDGPEGTTASTRAAASPAAEYRVRRGDTLRAIAASHRVQGASLDQMLVALVRRNPEAFDGGNMNRLRAGAILSIPDQAAVLEVEHAQARREIVAQAADFEAYRKRLAGAVAARPAPAEAGSTRASAGQIVPRVEQAMPEGQQDRVEVSGARQEEAERTRIARLEALEEELVAREKALEEANSRLAELEKTVRDLQRLVELRNEGLAQLQQQALAQQPGAETTASAAPPESAVPAAPVQAEPVAPMTQGEDRPPVEASQAPAASSEAPTVPAQPATPPEPAAAVQPAPAAPAPASEPAAIPERPVSTPAPAPVEYEEPGFLQTLLDDPTLLAGGGAALAILLGYAGLRMRKRRKEDESASQLSGMSEFPSEAQSAFGVKGGQSVDTGSSSVLQSDFSQSGLSAIDADEGVDPVAEADVYMAYGRDAQAEEILLDALKTDVSRGAIYLKLLEIYAQRKSIRQFESVATDFYSRTGGAGSDWAKAAEMGRKLDPENPLYRQSQGAEEVEPVDTQPGTQPGMEPLPSAELQRLPEPHEPEIEAEPEPAEDVLHFEMPEPAASVEEAREEESSVQPAGADKSALRFEDTWALPGQSEEAAEQAEPAAADQPVAEAESEESGYAVLDFDLGMEPEQQVTAEAAQPEAGVADEAVAAVDETFELDLGETPVSQTSSTAPAQAEPSAATAEASMNATVINEGQFFSDFAGDSDGDDAQVSAAPAQESESNLDSTVFNNDLLNFDFDIDSAPVGGTPNPPVDLSSIDLDLSDEAAAPAEDSRVQVDEPALEGADAFELPETGDQVGALSVEPDAGSGAPAEDLLQEVDTKLDLARAYEEMGDKEGARELVEEVLREGNAEQQAAARSLLERLS